MKALELLYKYQHADEIAGGYMSKPINEAIKELEELNATQKTTKNKFKIGDWVVYPVGIQGSEEILQIRNIDEKDFCSFRNCSKMYQIDKLRLWKPKPGEWGWVYNVTREVPYLRKVIRVEDNYKNRFNNYKFTKAVIVSRGDTSGEVGYRFCEPFIGELPSLIDNKRI